MLQVDSLQSDCYTVSAFSIVGFIYVKCHLVASWLGCLRRSYNVRINFGAPDI